MGNVIKRYKRTMENFDKDRIKKKSRLESKTKVIQKKSTRTFFHEAEKLNR